MDIIELLPESLITLVVATNMLGILLKQIEVVKDNFIPLILLTFSIVFSVALLGFNAQNILHGIICWGVSVGVHQTVHQFKK